MPKKQVEGMPDQGITLSKTAEKTLLELIKQMEMVWLELRNATVMDEFETSLIEVSGKIADLQRKITQKQTILPSEIQFLNEGIETTTKLLQKTQPQVLFGPTVGQGEGNFNVAKFNEAFSKTIKSAQTLQKELKGKGPLATFANSVLNFFKSIGEVFSKLKVSLPDLPSFSGGIKSVKKAVKGPANDPEIVRGKKKVRK